MKEQRVIGTLLRRFYKETKIEEVPNLLETLLYRSKTFVADSHSMGRLVTKTVG